MQIILEITTIIASLINPLFPACYVQPNPLWYKPVPAEIKRAMRKMGPQRDYRIFPDGRLEVKVKGRWLRLKY